MTSKTPSIPNYARNRSEAKQESLPGTQNGVWGVRLPATVAAEPAGVGASGATATTATTPTTTATATATTPAATTTTAAAVADHLGETGVNLLLGLGQDGDEVTSLLGICERRVSYAKLRHNGGGNVLSVVKKVMAVPLAPARPVRPIRWT